MANLAKPVRKRDPEYLAWVRQQRSVVTGQITTPGTEDRRNRVEPNHIRLEGHGGMGTKPDDSRALPFIGWLHDIYHEMGRRAFEEHYGINLEYQIRQHNLRYLAEHPKPKRERKPKVKTIEKRLVHRAWAIVLGDELCFPIVATLEEAKSMKGTEGKVWRCQIRLEGHKSR